MDQMTFLLDVFLFLVVMPFCVVMVPLLLFVGFFKFIDKFFPNIQRF